MPTFTNCPNCHAPITLQVADSAFVPTAPASTPALPKLKQKDFNQRLDRDAVHAWLRVYRFSTKGPLLGDEPVETPPWGRDIPAADTWADYTAWAWHVGARIMSARSFFWALRWFGVVATRTGQGRFHRFPAERPGRLNRDVHCPRRQADLPFPPLKLPWIANMREMASADPAGPWDESLQRAEDNGWFWVDAPSMKLGPAPTLWADENGSPLPSTPAVSVSRPEPVEPVVESPGPEAAVSALVEPAGGLEYAEDVPMAREWAEDVPPAEPAAEPVDPEYAEEAADSAPSSSWPPPRWSERYAERPLVKPTPFAAGARDGQPSSE